METLKLAKHTNGKEYPCKDDGKTILWTPEAITKYVLERKNKISSANSSLKTSSYTSKQQKYKTPIKEPTYTKHTYTDDTIKRVTKLSMNGLKGKECLKEFIEAFNKSKNFKYKVISEFDDSKINELIDFIESQQPPTDI